MNYVRLLGIAILFVFLGLGTVGGCGSSGGDESGNNEAAPPTNTPPTTPPATNPPITQCQVPPLNTDFSSTGYFFIDESNSVLIGLTSNGENVALILSDIPDSGEVLGLGGSVQGENTSDIFTALDMGMFINASGKFERMNNGQMLKVNDLVIADIPFGDNLNAECENSVPFDAGQLSIARHKVIEQLKAKGKVRSVTNGQTNVLDFVNLVLDR